MGFIQDFKDFAFKGNLIDMAVGIVMGTASAAIVKSFLENIISPLLSVIVGVPDLSGLKFNIGGAVAKLDAAGDPILNKEGVEVMEQAAIQYGAFIQNVLDFAILAFVIFLALKIVSSWMKKAEKETPPPAEVVLLTEIRDALQK